MRRRLDVSAPFTKLPVLKQMGGLVLCFAILSPVAPFIWTPGSLPLFDRLRVRSRDIRPAANRRVSRSSAGPIERVIGTIRRECLDHLIILNEAALHRHLKMLQEYYHSTRTHLSLEKDTPDSRSVQPPESGRVVAVPQVGGLHHGYEHRAA
jgi:hypothetical protein